MQRIKILITFLLPAFIFLSKANAQLCQGSLGDPVVNITFGAGNNPGPSIGNLTNYTYLAADCPQDGSYTIENATRNCNGDTWHSVTDHTGDPNGYMMVINASNQPGDFFVKTVGGLCPNTTYEFASWILNVTKASACGGNPIKPNVTFSIETTTGTVLQTYQTGDIAAGNSPLWKQYGFFFSTDFTTESVVIRMTNNAPGPCGNDLLLDDITFRACGPLVTAGISGASNTVNVCTGDNKLFTLLANVSAGYTDPVYQWQLSKDGGASWANIAGAVSTTYVRQSITTPGLYLYRFAVSQKGNINISNCSIFSNVVSVGVNNYPVPATSNRAGCTGDSLLLTANGGASFSWSGPSGFSSSSQSPFIAVTTIGNSGTYYVKVTSTEGCTSLDSTKVQLTIKPVANAGNDVEVCQGVPVQLNARGTNITSYNWSPATGLSDPNISNPIATPAENTLYILTVGNRECKVSDSLQLTIDKAPSANAGPDKIILAGQSVVLNGIAGGTNVSYTWTPDNSLQAATTLTPIANPVNTQEYILRVVSNIGCGIASDTMSVKVFNKLYVPNAFTPNGDGLNDTWLIETLAVYPGAEVKVYNRYGQMVFNNKGQNISWDGYFKGSPLPAGAYVYIINLKNNTPLIKGVVYVIL
ncbi:MAG: gliding motility-associated C-terminal domain-containing protein [Ginsengibacter sp.]